MTYKKDVEMSPDFCFSTINFEKQFIMTFSRHRFTINERLMNIVNSFPYKYTKL